MRNTVQINGVGCHWGTGTTSITSYGTLVLTAVDHNETADRDYGIDSSGFTVTVGWFNHSETANFEVWMSGSAASSTVGITTSTLPQIGDTVIVVDTTHTRISGSTWLVESVNTKKVNNSLARGSVGMVRYAKI